MAYTFKKTSSNNEITKNNQINKFFLKENVDILSENIGMFETIKKLKTIIKLIKK
jgi:hypothetical protein